MEDVHEMQNQMDSGGREHGITEETRLLQEDNDIDTHQQQESDTVLSSENIEHSISPAENKKYMKLFLGYINILTGQLSVCIGMALVQALDRSIPHAELNGLRYTLQTFLSCIVVGCTRKCDIKLKRKDIVWVGVGSVVAVSLSITSYGRSYYLPLGVASSVGCTIQLIVICIMAIAIHRSIDVSQLVAVFICVTGILLILQPRLIFRRIRPPLVHAESKFHSPCNNISIERLPKNYTHEALITNATIPGNSDLASLQDEVIGYCFVVADAFLKACYVEIFNYKLNETDPFVYMFWSSIFGFLISFCLMGIFETPTFPTVGICLVFLIFHIITSSTVNFFFVHGFQLLPATVSSLIMTLQIPLMFALQYTVLYGMYPGNANELEIIGAVVVFIGSVLTPVHTLLSYLKSRDK